MKASEYYASIRVERDKWKQERLAEFPYCWLCGSSDLLVVHEIAKRSQAPNKWGERCNYFLACNHCNCGPLQGGVSIKDQLVLKKVRDREHFDHARVNELRGRSPLAITLEEIELAEQTWAFRFFHLVVAQKTPMRLKDAL